MNSKRDKFLAKVERTIREHALIPPGAHVLAAVSGGADSVALARSLAALRGKHGWRLTLCYVHHRQRAAADEEAIFVDKLARELGAGFELRSLPAEFRKLYLTGSLEADMRAARYWMLGIVAKEIEAKIVATGHNEDDLVETVLWNFLRGSGITGMRGFEVKVKLVGMVVIRPLIGFKRDEIREWLKLKSFPWREDESNEDMGRMRNFLRHQVLGRIKKEFNLNVAEGIKRTAEIAGTDTEYMMVLEENAFPKTFHEINGELASVDLSLFAQLPMALRRRVARAMLCLVKMTDDHPVGSALSLAFEEWLRVGEAGSMFRPRNGVVFYRDCEKAYMMLSKLGRTAKSAGLLDELREVLWKAGELKKLAPTCVKPETAQREIDVLKLKEDGKAEVEWNRQQWIFQWGKDKGNGEDVLAIAHIPASMLGERLELRFRKDGDRMVKDDGSLGKKLKDVLIDNKVPLVTRDWLPLLANERGVLWIPGIGTKNPGAKDSRNDWDNTLKINGQKKERRETREDFLCVHCDSARE